MHHSSTIRARVAESGNVLSPQYAGRNMSQNDQDQNTNKRANCLLAAMSEADYALLSPHLETVSLEREKVLVEIGKPISHCYFPEGGIASIVALSEEGDRTEVGIFGSEGVSAIPFLLGSDRSTNETFIQVDGATALRIEVEKFRAALEHSASLKELMLHYVYTMTVQMSASVVSNARLQIEGRLARWLLMCRDRSDRDDIKLTHEFMAFMIGAQRSGVTLALHVLEGIGTIRSARGVVTILDRDKLVELAGDSYGEAEAEYRRLIGPFGNTLIRTL